MKEEIAEKSSSFTLPSFKPTPQYETKRVSQLNMTSHKQQCQTLVNTAVVVLKHRN